MTGPVCKICGDQESRFLWKGKDRFYHLDGVFNLFRCRRCGLIFVYPFLSDVELVKYYPQNYYSYKSFKRVSAPPDRKEPKAVYYLKHPLKAANAMIYSKLLGQNADVAVPAGGEVLDVGCGDGRFLLEKRNNGYRISGVDISESALSRLKSEAPEAVIYCGNLWDAKFPIEHFDLIHLSHVVEHVVHIDKLVSEIRRILKPGGRVAIQIPNAASLTFLLFGPLWIHLDVPRHVYVFSKKNLRRFFEDHSFYVEKVRTLENSFSVLGCLIYVWNALFGSRKRIDDTRKFWDSEVMKLLLAPYALAVNIAGVGDTMEFILTKKGH